MPGVLYISVKKVRVPKKMCFPNEIFIEKIKAACVNDGKILQTRYCIKSAVPSWKQKK